MIEVNHLNLKKENKFILDDIHFKINPGELVLVIGPNGAGKTSFMNCLSQVENEFSGEIKLEGRNMSSISPKDRAKKISVLPQGFEMVFPYTVRELVLMSRFPYQKKSFEHESDYAYVDEIMNRVGIKGFENRIFQTLSGGEKQRVWLAKTLAQEAAYMILDEPWNHLDYKFQSEMLKLISSEVKENNLGVIWITHHLNVIPFADRIILMNHGSIETELKAGDPGLKDWLEKIYEINFFNLNYKESEIIFPEFNR